MTYSYEGWKGGFIPEEALKESVTIEAVIFAEKFGQYLGKKVTKNKSDKQDNRVKSTEKVIAEPLNTSQLRKFFGEVKRQQIKGYELSSFILLKPKLAYAVGRSKEKKIYNKIIDLAQVLYKAIDIVAEFASKENQKPFENFIDIFEAIVAYHKEETGEKSNKN